MPRRATATATTWLPSYCANSNSNSNSAAMSLLADGSMGPELQEAQMVTVQDVRAWAMSLPRTEEHLIHDHVKFRVGKIVYASVSPDETIMGFGFRRDERAALIAAEPTKFCLPRLSDQRFHWVHARMAAVGVAEMRELITEAWRMVVPKRLAAAHLGQATLPPGATGSARPEPGRGRAG